MNVGKCAAGLAVMCAVGTGCAVFNGTCKVIDAAHDTCVVLQYLASDGGTVQVSVSPGDLAAYGRATAAGEYMVPVGKAGCK